MICAESDPSHGPAPGSSHRAATGSETPEVAAGEPGGASGALGTYAANFPARAVHQSLGFRIGDRWTSGRLDAAFSAG
jgi:hypothetical protein